ncbi:MAG: MotA/TolQ/ExbB proton channel family protein [Bacteroidota bacterium]|nr:MotA/TolQ/ExbB proton channel family protein [Bacteroidota bacterium]
MSDNKSSVNQTAATAVPTKKAGMPAFTGLAILSAIIVSMLIFFFVLGNPANFVDGDTSKHPIEEGAGKWLGTVFKGGIVVPIILSLLLMTIIFTIERLMTLSRAKGSGNVDNFLRRVKMYLSSNNIQAALAECDKQKGSVASVVKSGLLKYNHVFNLPDLDKEQKLSAIQKEIEEATALELPMLEKNLVVIATIASVATLMGLFGTVLGMIKAFSALANAGAPDASALSTGISEALINTALGIGTSALAIIFYNYFTSRIDSLTFNIDEAGFSISQTFASNYKEVTVQA